MDDSSGFTVQLTAEGVASQLSFTDQSTVPTIKRKTQSLSNPQSNQRRVQYIPSEELQELELVLAVPLPGLRDWEDSEVPVVEVAVFILPLEINLHAWLLASRFF
ncbi:hypothetical protein VNO78_17499 [Psophocarpus tetragonolobus]|uniref:Uncharacterized protein n=1 Tax=Psophocarpus tetragonolobus TaxID=3891 RepID=A0AAN9SHD5_PSOTE